MGKIVVVGNAYPDGAHALQEAVQAQFPEANVLTADIGPHWSLYWSRYAGADLLGKQSLKSCLDGGDIFQKMVLVCRK